MSKPNNPNTPDNLQLWAKLAPVDKKFTKPITGKSYKGDSPNPTYVIRKLTEALGPIGLSWGFTVKYDRIREGVPHQVIKSQHVQYSQDGKTMLSKSVDYELIREQYHEVCIEFWFDNGPSGLGKFDAFGGTPLLYMTKSGKWMHDEDAAKKSLTDAYTKGASWLGACADIFLGLFDDKYQSADHGDVPVRTGASSPAFDTPAPDKTANGQRQSSAPADDGWG